MSSSLSNIGLLGIKAGNTALSVSGNNIVNSKTHGFKRSVAQFADVYSAVSSTNMPGQGVSISGISKNMEGGALVSTGRTFDLALSGEGFFVSQELGGAGNQSYTRSGAMQIDKNGLLRSIDSGQQIMGYAATNGVLGGQVAGIDLSVNGGMAAAATTTVDVDFNVNSTSTAVTTTTPTTLDTTDITEYNTLMATSVYDSLGNTHAMNMYMRKSANNTWELYGQLDDGAATRYATLGYTTGGALDSITALNGATAATTTTLTLPNITPTGGAADLSITLNLANTTQYGADNNVGSPTINGNAAGEFSRYNVDESGIIYAAYSNGETQALAQVAVATFPNQGDLSQSGQNTWISTPDSGDAVYQTAGERASSVVQSGSLEESNVDLTRELVNMVDFQRYFSANARIVQTSNQLSQTILNIR